MPLELFLFFLLGFRVLGFRVLGFRILGFRVFLLLIMLLLKPKAVALQIRLPRCIALLPCILPYGCQGRRQVGRAFMRPYTASSGYEPICPSTNVRVKKLCAVDMRLCYAESGCSLLLGGLCQTSTTPQSQCCRYGLGRWRGAAMASKPLTAPSSSRRGTLVAGEGCPGEGEVAERKSSGT